MGIAAIVLTVALATFAAARVSRAVGLTDRVEALLGVFVISSAMFPPQADSHESGRQRLRPTAGARDTIGL